MAGCSNIEARLVLIILGLYTVTLEEKADEALNHTFLAFALGGGGQGKSRASAACHGIHSTLRRISSTV